ncbi:hypothetical protein M7I_6759 [Glarea lozoyensis 74030]|uniref:Uncharacterized protein n=1 Tax=Glarea lozoyensis (strain ATCC 74030 / MF5533) TaxID=1104152 RepID=H0EVG1_GLAL7|nr:hypothetical protein M7I_6759 [Glarea lozoyensis 74030]
MSGKQLYQNNNPIATSSKDIDIPQNGQNSSSLTDRSHLTRNRQNSNLTNASRPPAAGPSTTPKNPTNPPEILKLPLVPIIPGPDPEKCPKFMDFREIDSPFPNEIYCPAGRHEPCNFARPKEDYAVRAKSFTNESSKITLFIKMEICRGFEATLVS